MLLEHLDCNSSSVSQTVATNLQEALAALKVLLKHAHCGTRARPPTVNGPPLDVTPSRTTIFFEETKLKSSQIFVYGRLWEVYVSSPSLPFDYDAIGPDMILISSVAVLMNMAMLFQWKADLSDHQPDVVAQLQHKSSCLYQMVLEFLDRMGRHSTTLLSLRITALNNLATLYFRGTLSGSHVMVDRHTEEFLHVLEQTMAIALNDGAPLLSPIEMDQIRLNILRFRNQITTTGSVAAAA